MPVSAKNAGSSRIVDQIVQPGLERPGEAAVAGYDGAEQERTEDRVDTDAMGISADTRSPASATAMASPRRFGAGSGRQLCHQRAHEADHARRQTAA